MVLIAIACVVVAIFCKQEEEIDNENKPLLLFAVCCAIPLVLAYSALKLDWLPTAITNHGEFLEREIKLDNWAQHNLSNGPSL